MCCFCLSTFLPVISAGQQSVEDVIVPLSRVLSYHPVLEQKQASDNHTLSSLMIIHTSATARAALSGHVPSNKGCASYLFKQILGRHVKKSIIGTFGTVNATRQALHHL